MATPITPTPVLRGQEAVEFLKRIELDESKPLYCKPTPKLEEARRLAVGKWGKK